MKYWPKKIKTEQGFQPYMTNPGALSKRIKRHVIGRVQEFFAATSPGLENVCQEELHGAPLSVANTSVSGGGVTFNGRLPDCYQANLYLRTANRVLMRIGSFKATNFRRLDKKLADFPWELYLPVGVTPQIHATAHHSRLFHKKAIIRHVRDSIHLETLSDEKAGASQSQHSSGMQQIFVRVQDDRFTLSIDSSGELLHKRGLKRASGRAPLRETIAAAALIRAGYTGREVLVDPLCGSGTFSLEGAMRALNIPAGQFRNFAFFDWPCFRPSQWEFIKRQAQSSSIKIRKPMIFASDKNPAVCRALKRQVSESGFSDAVRVEQKDFTDLSPRQIMKQADSAEPGIVALNPPYGRRLGTFKESQQLFDEIFQKLKSDFSGWKLALIVPDKKIAQKVPFKVKSVPLFHGGLRLTLLFGRI
jgi:putative N6-adenine-specific DNA methylase